LAAKPCTRQSHRAEWAPGGGICPAHILHARVHGLTTWLVQCRFMEPARMLCWGSPLPSSLASSRRPGRPPDPRRPVGRLLRWKRYIGEMAPFSSGFDERADAQGRLRWTGRWLEDAFDGGTDTWDVTSIEIFRVGAMLRSAHVFLGAGFEVGITDGGNAPFIAWCPIRH
jgi:hypothetical protein